MATHHRDAGRSDSIARDPHRGVYLDATFGRGGHSRALLQQLSPAARVLAIDRDPQAVASALAGPERIADARFSIHHAPFSQMARTLRAAGVEQVHGVLFDLGVSSPQIDDPQRGFSFRFDAPWTCAWTRPKARVPRSTWRAPTSARSPA